ncbi:MAG TPA: hypothetical protein VGG64_16270 [Pirellulales bacterium]
MMPFWSVSSILQTSPAPLKGFCPKEFDLPPLLARGSDARP